MPVEYSEATAIVLMTGLGIVGFNERRKRCETLLIHDKEQHRPRLMILKPSADPNFRGDDAGIPLNGYEIWIDHDSLSTDRLKISIIGSGSSAVEGVERFHGARFDRRSLADSDPNDWRWVPDPERDGLLGDGRRSRRKSAEHKETSRVNLRNCLMFTHSLCAVTDRFSKTAKAVPVEFFRRTIRKDANDSVQIDSEPFGPVTDYVGAKFVSKTVRIDLAEGGSVISHVLRKSDRPYLIVVSNAQRVETTVSDMPVYQSFWDVDAAMTDLESLSELQKTFDDHDLPVPEDLGGKAHGVRRTCNLIAVEDGIDEFVK